MCACVKTRCTYGDQTARRFTWSASSHQEHQIHTHTTYDHIITSGTHDTDCGQTMTIIDFMLFLSVFWFCLWQRGLFGLFVWVIRGEVYEVWEFRFHSKNHSGRVFAPRLWTWSSDSWAKRDRDSTPCDELNDGYNKWTCRFIYIQVYMDIYIYLVVSYWWTLDNNFWINVLNVRDHLLW